MKVILEYNLPEEQEDLEYAMWGWKWQVVCWELDRILREHLKYGTSFPNGRDSTIKGVRELLHDILSDNQLELK